MWFVANPDTCTLRIINPYNFSGPELCWATPETGPRKSCLFPFTYRNHNYSACLTDEVHKAWCPTGKTIEDKYTGWAECDLDCPRTGDGKWTISAFPLHNKLTCYSHHNFSVYNIKLWVCYSLHLWGWNLFWMCSTLLARFTLWSKALVSHGPGCQGEIRQRQPLHCRL